LILYNFLRPRAFFHSARTVEKAGGALQGRWHQGIQRTIPQRHAELLKRFGNRPGFSIFIGVGKLMAQGLKQGAHGIVPSVGNLISESLS